MDDYIKYLRKMVGKSKVILVVAGVLVFDENDCLLLHRRSDNGYWGIPGGFMELGETVEDTARREVLEETGLTLGKMELFNVYSGPERDQVLNNGDELSGVSIVYVCRDFTGEFKLNDESLEVKFFSLESLPENLFPVQNYLFEDLLSKHKRRL
jgi:ADP-ribose pyrophosphatase YjhB (NUDIX family)